MTVDAVRKRIQRGTIPHERHEDGRVWVLLDAASNLQDNDQHKYRTATHPTADALVESLSEQVEYLKGVVATRDEEIRRRDHIIAGLVERGPALEAAASPEQRDGHETPAGVSEGRSPARPQGGRRKPRSSALGGAGSSALSNGDHPGTDKPPGRTFLPAP